MSCPLTAVGVCCRGEMMGQVVEVAQKEGDCPVNARRRLVVVRGAPVAPRIPGVG